jgi:hypothetical protein
MLVDRFRLSFSLSFFVLFLNEAVRDVEEEICNSEDIDALTT